MKSYNYLNLQQKMLKVRKKMPALLRKHYSDEVDYDFVKLDDINKHLTPALNKYGINFAILREDAACIENGRKVFLTKTETGWLYEADLTVQWVNVDRPEEKETAVIHLIGTNEMPDKAKGTALTYGIKYYLFNRFNIDQGADEDPDYCAAGKDMQHSNKDTSAEEKKTQANGGRTVSSSEAEQAAQELLSRRGRKVRKAKADDSTASVKAQTDESGKTGYPSEKKHSDAGITETTRGSKAEESEKKKPASDVAEKAKDSDPAPVNAVEVEKEISVSAMAGDEMAVETEAVPEKAKPPVLASTDRVAPKDTSQENMDEPEEGQEAGDGVEKVSEPTPFDVDEEDPFLKELQADIEKQEEKEMPSAEAAKPCMTIEEAKKVVCTFGYHLNKTYGEVLADGDRGRRTLEWTVTRFKGNDTAQVEAARILLAEFDAIHGKKAA